MGNQYVPKGAPDLEKAAGAFKEFCTTVARLREPEHGCPWDLKQTHQSLRGYMLEESYEAVDAMGNDDSTHLKEELGDVLLQVVLNSQLARDAKNFSIVEVIEGINAKMHRRHPHVFGEDKEARGKSADSLREQWYAIKANEKGGEEKTQRVFHKVEKERYPSTTQAMKIGKVAQKIRFDWDGPEAVFEKLQSEVKEFEVEFKKAKVNKKAMELELGDVYFTLAQLCRHLDLDPEVTAAQGNQKFLTRFSKLEDLARKENLDLLTLGKEEGGQAKMEALWEKAKKLK